MPQAQQGLLCGHPASFVSPSAVVAPSSCQAPGQECQQLRVNRDVPEDQRSMCVGRLSNNKCISMSGPVLVASGSCTPPTAFHLRQERCASKHTHSADTLFSRQSSTSQQQQQRAATAATAAPYRIGMHTCPHRTPDAPSPGETHRPHSVCCCLPGCCLPACNLCYPPPPQQMPA